MNQSKIISLVLFPLFILAMILPLPVGAQGDSQEELIIEVLKASGDDLGLSGFIAPIDMYGDVLYGDEPAYMWSGTRNEYDVVMDIILCTTEQDAMAILQDSLSHPTIYHSAEFHGYPAAVSEIVQSYQWHCGRFFFSVRVEGPESMEDTANVLYANAVKYGLISGQEKANPESGESQWKAVPETGQDQGKATPEAGDDQDESVSSEDRLEELEGFIEEFKEVLNSFIDWIKSIFPAK